MYQIVRKPNMNRVYVTGDVDPLRKLLSDFRARYDSDTSYWLPIREESRLRAAIEAEAAYLTGADAAQKAWESAKAVIPSDYRSRHGAAYGGDVVINGEVISEPALDASRLPWVEVAEWVSRVRDLSGQSSINGRVRDRETLYSAVVADGRTIYRIAHWSGFGDDVRETYYLPADLWERAMTAEVRMRGITSESAAAWLAQYRGCAGTEMYEFAALRGVTA